MTRYFENFITHAEKEIETTIKQAFNSSEYKTPNEVDEAIRKNVAKVKVYEAEGRQMELMQKLWKLPKKNGVTIVDQGNQHLVDEFEEMRIISETWAPFMDT